MTGEVIKSFLVGLGFGIDETSLAKFNKAITSAAVRVTALAVSIKVAAAGIFYGISKISEGFENLGYEMRLVAPAVNKTLQLRKILLDTYRAAGIDIKKTVQESILFNLSLTKTKYALEAIVKGTAARFLPMLTKQMDIFRAKIFANMPKIQAQLERFIKFIFKAFDAVVQLGSRLWSMLGRVWDVFAKLDEATDGWSTKIIALIAAWKLLNLSFIATPLGMILTGFIALLALWDDFKTFQEGGESLFNWKAAEPAINAAIKAFKDLFGIVIGIAGAIKDLISAVIKLASLDFSGFVGSLDKVGGKILDVGKKFGGLFSSSFEAIDKGGDFIAKAITGTSGFLPNSGNGTTKAAAGPVLGNFAGATPLGADNAVRNSQNSQTISQETSIIVQGSADANATGKAVANEQSKVNFDMARNMKGAVR